MCAVGRSADPPPRSELVLEYDEPSRVLVVGGGFGGLYTALRLAQYKWSEADIHPPRITVVDPSPRFVFKPLLYELVTGEATVGQVAPMLSGVLSPSGIEYVQGRVTSIETADDDLELAGRAQLDAEGAAARPEGYIDYDYLVVGSGSEPHMSAVPGARENALTFNGIDDAQRLVAELEELERGAGGAQVVVVGGGLAGVELAATVAGRVGPDVASVDLVTSNSTIMDGSGNDLRSVAQDELSRCGVRVRTHTRVVGVERRDTDTTTGSAPFTLRTSIDQTNAENNDEGSTEAADMVLWAAGQSSASVPSFFGPDARVEPTLLVSGCEREFVIGDAAALGLPSTAQVAMQQAEHCAWCIAADMEDEPLRAFEYKHLGNLMSFGRLSGAAAVAIPGLGEITLKGPVASALRKLVYLYRMPTQRQAAAVGLEWLRDLGMWVPRDVPRGVDDFKRMNPIASDPPSVADVLARPEVRAAVDSIFGAVTERAMEAAEGARRAATRTNKQRAEPMPDPHSVSDSLDDDAVAAIVKRLEARGRDEVFRALFDGYFDAIPPDARVLEVGCGTGVMGRLLVNRSGFKGTVTGVDQCEGFLDAARERAEQEGCDAKRLRFVKGDAHALGDALGKDGGGYDVVVMHTLLSHAADPAAALRAAADVAAQGAKLVVVDGDYGSLTYAHDRDAELGRKMDRALVEATFRNANVVRELVATGFYGTGWALERSQAACVSEVGTDASFWATFAECYAPRVKAAGMVPPRDVDAWIQEQERAAKEGTFFASCNYYTLFAGRVG